MSEVNERRQRLLTALTATTDALHGLDDDQRSAYGSGIDLVERVVAYSYVVVEQTDPDLITEAALSSIETAANGIVASLTAAITSPRAYIDNLLTPLATLPVARDRDVEQAVKETAANFQRSATHRLNALKSDVDSKAAAIDGALAKLRESVAETTAATNATFQSEAAAFEAKLAEFETTISTQQTAIAAARERQSEAFTEAQEERATSFQTEVAQASDAVAAMLNDAKDEVNRHVDEIRRMERESSDLVGAIGLAGTSERYGVEAVDQKQVADRLRLATIGLALGAVGMAISPSFTRPKTHQQSSRSSASRSSSAHSRPTRGVSRDVIVYARNGRVTSNSSSQHSPPSSSHCTTIRRRSSA